MGKKKKGRKGSAGKNHAASAGSSRKWRKTLIIGAVVMVGLSGGIALGMNNNIFQNQNDLLDESGVIFPAYVKASTTPNARKGYLFAVQYTDEMKQIPCFCGCGKHAGHDSVHDCFIAWDDPEKKNTRFDEHGANCKMCVDIVLDAVKGLQEGRSLQDVRNSIEEQWQNDRDSMTPTPPIAA